MTSICVPGRIVVVDVEGTTSPTAAVHVTLYDYARPRLAGWIEQHPDDAEVCAAVAAIRAEAGLSDDAGTQAVVDVLHSWMDRDVKAAPLKTLQGRIWAAGFAAGELNPVFFEDVALALRAWHQQGLTLSVFSSGSVTSQRAWFGHGPEADLGGRMAGFFDTVSAGPKREGRSYARIAEALRAAPGDCIFLSDVTAELDAARDAGWQTVWVSRPGEPHASTSGRAPHPTISSFAEVTVVEPDVWAAGQRLATESARLERQGFMPATAGNLSEVLRVEPFEVVVTASGVDKGALGPEQVVVIARDGRPLRGAAPNLAPSAEGALHAHVAARTGAGAVVHVHAMSAVLAGARWPRGVELQDVELLKALGRRAHDDVVRVPVVANSQDMSELAAGWDEVANLDVPGFIVADHGLYVWGRTVQEARFRTEAFEWLMRYALERDSTSAVPTR